MSRRRGLRCAALFLLMILPLAAQQGDLQPTRLQVENRVDPMGIDVMSPRLSWNFNWSGASQYAYQVRAASSEGLLQQGMP